MHLHDAIIYTLAEARVVTGTTGFISLMYMLSDMVPIDDAEFRAYSGAMYSGDAVGGLHTLIGLGFVTSRQTRTPIDRKAKFDDYHVYDYTLDDHGWDAYYMLKEENPKVCRDVARRVRVIRRWTDLDRFRLVTMGQVFYLARTHGIQNPDMSIRYDEIIEKAADHGWILNRQDVYDGWRLMGALRALDAGANTSYIVSDDIVKQALQQLNNNTDGKGI